MLPPWKSAQTSARPGVTMPHPDLDDLRELFLDPRSDALDVGLRLHALTREDLRAMGHGSLRELLKGLLPEGRRPEYSTVMRWVRAASVLRGPDDPRREWGVSRLAEVARCSAPESRRKLLQARSRTIGSTPVRELRKAVVVHGAESRDSPDADEPHSVLERAIGIALRHERPGSAVEVEVRRSRGRGRGKREAFAVVATGGATDADMAAALGAASRVTSAIATARAAWRRGPSPEPVRVPRPMPLDEIVELPPGQLEARWVSPDVVQVTKAGTPILHLRVERAEQTNHRVIWPQGNVKLEGVFGVVDSISHGCLRVATGWPGTHEPCFTIDGDRKTTGCYANHTKWAGLPESRKHGFDVTRNGLTNRLMKVRLPLDGSPSLARWKGRIWRVDAESTDGALSISLGIFQVFAEANPTHRLMTICSHQFRPPDEMLAWLSALRNAWTGHTVAAGGLSPDELDVRFDSIRRFLDWGVPCAIWIVTHPDWDDRGVLDRALEFVPPEAIIEAPYRFRTLDQALPVLHVNPLGACSDHRLTRYGVPCHVRLDVEHDGHEVVPVLVDPHGGIVTHAAHSKCSGGCRLLCGVNVIDRRDPAR